MSALAPNEFSRNVTMVPLHLHHLTLIQFIEISPLIYNGFLIVRLLQNYHTISLIQFMYPYSQWIHHNSVTRDEPHPSNIILIIQQTLALTWSTPSIPPLATNLFNQFSQCIRWQRNEKAILTIKASSRSNKFVISEFSQM